MKSGRTFSEPFKSSSITSHSLSQFFKSAFRIEKLFFLFILSASFLSFAMLGFSLLPKSTLMAMFALL